MILTWFGWVALIIMLASIAAIVYTLGTLIVDISTFLKEKTAALRRTV